MKSKRVDPPGVTVLTPKGRMVGGSETDDLKKAIDDVVEKGDNKLVVDLGETLYLNSSALGILIAAHKKFAEKGGKMKLCRVNKSIENILVITKLSLVFEVFDEETDAIASFK